MKNADHLPVPAAATLWLQALPETELVAKVARSTDDTRLPPKARRGLGNYIQHLAKLRFPPVSRLILFGSHARDDFRADSDVDLAIVLAGEPPGENAGSEALRLTRVLTDADIASFDETGISVAPVVLWEGDLLRPEKHPRPSFYRNILAEGIRITPAL
ncbi:MAG: nucleotidyltransferase domain-containing protein [Bacteroidetes bacterium SB0662_bin_6]|nr:nucleotidyltransferase domain-containing protein [Gammaproteobacteria bacterium]MYE04856.1 nucleotidyltransferase domain-containing protein [Bacteroidetes bacterium SB0662_bin_6]